MRKYFKWSTTRFLKNGSKINHYRRYGRKTYRVRSFYRPKKMNNPFFTGF